MSNRTLTDQTAVCTTCQQPRPVKEFLAAPHAPSGRLEKCTPCIRGAAAADRELRQQRLAAQIDTKAAHAKLAQAGALKLTVPAGNVPKARRRTPGMPRVSMADNRPTPERAAKAPEGVETATGTRAHRVVGAVEVYKAHFSEELLAAAARFLRSHAAVNAPRISSAYDPMPGGGAKGNGRGGVGDDQRKAHAEATYIEAKMEAPFYRILQWLVIGVEAQRSNEPRTVAEVASTILGYRHEDTARPAGVGMLWGTLVRLVGLYRELVGPGERVWSTAEEIAARRQERQHQATTAKVQFARERKAREDDAAV